jgi:hypothetical protein
VVTTKSSTEAQKLSGKPCGARDFQDHGAEMLFFRKDRTLEAVSRIGAAPV